MRVLLAIALFSSIAVTDAVAQTELGMDLGVIYSKAVFDGPGDPDGFTTISVPLQRVRAAFTMSEVLSLELSGAFSRLSSDGDAVSEAALGVMGQYLLGELAEGQATPYVAGGVGLNRLAGSSGSDDESATLLSAGVAGGIKRMFSDNAAFRGEVQYMRRFENEDEGFLAVNSFGLLFGLSFFVGG